MGTIPFMIDSNLGKHSVLEIYWFVWIKNTNVEKYELLSKAEHRDKIIQGMNQYHQNTCIRFVERTNQYDYVHISKDQGYSFNYIIFQFH